MFLLGTCQTKCSSPYNIPDMFLPDSRYPRPQCHVQVGEVVLRVCQGRPDVHIPGLRIGSGARTSGILVPLEVEVERTDSALIGLVH